MAESAKWYVVHTYSAYENKVATNIEKVVENRRLQDLIHEVKIPTEMITEVGPDNKMREVERKLFPGYVLVKMVMTDESWYAVRNIRGVTGFVGADNKPVPLTEQEIASLGVERDEPVTADQKIEVDFTVGNEVSIVAGPLNGFNGTVESIDTDNNRVMVSVSMFGRDTSVELELNQVRLAD